VAIGVLSAGQAQAVVVNVNGQNWNVTTFEGSYNANVSKFNTAANGGSMPWWGSAELAEEFTVAVNTQLGADLNGQNNGPFFAQRLASLETQMLAWRWNNNPAVDGPDQTQYSLSVARWWATADLAAPVPGPLPALGLGAAFGFSRKLRKRIKSKTNPVSSTFSL